MKQVKAILPHATAITIAVVAYFIARHLDSDSRCGFICLDGIFMAMYHLGLSCYVLGFAFTAGFIQQYTGAWKFGRSYLIAFLVAPVFVLPVAHIYMFIEKL